MSYVPEPPWAPGTWAPDVWAPNTWQAPVASNNPVDVGADLGHFALIRANSHTSLGGMIRYAKVSWAQNCRQFWHTCQSLFNTHCRTVRHVSGMAR